MKLRPLGDRVLVQPAKREEKTGGGLYIPDTAKGSIHRGEVLAVGCPRNECNSLQHESADGQDIEYLRPGRVVLYKEADVLQRLDDGLVLIETSDLLAVVVE